nr:hypothetical protein L203_06036 [Cryptococcus depauperatus CBS 7841]
MARSANPSDVEVIETAELEGCENEIALNRPQTPLSKQSNITKQNHVNKRNVVLTREKEDRFMVPPARQNALLTSYTTRAGLSGCFNHPSNSTSCFDSEASNHTALDKKKAKLEVSRLDEGAEPTPKV